ncbi:hypothetical protein ACC725_39040, partial [Rhizobium ruizarguesonis]
TQRQHRMAFAIRLTHDGHQLIEDGRENRVIDGIIETGCPVHILQGMKDHDVPHAHEMKLVEHLPADDVVLTFIRDGDHR